MLINDTIVAQATAPGQASIGVIRVSGPQARAVAQLILKRCPPARLAQHLTFNNAQQTPIDQGIALFFEGPNSFTGEDVLELQGHGGQVVLDMIMQAALSVADVRPAQPGEFSQRAFLNQKIDLAQAEAIADLIEATSEQAAYNATQSLQGQFSKQVNKLVEQVTALRMFVEAAIDFPEEEIDFLGDSTITSQLENILLHLKHILADAQQGSLIQEGMNIVIVGRPNAGKSSLLNTLAGHDRAIVTNIAGTTRDTLSETIHIDGLPLHIVDTAGLHDTQDQVEQIGIQRAWRAIYEAQRVLFIIDINTQKDAETLQLLQEVQTKKPEGVGLTILLNKVDLANQAIDTDDLSQYDVIRMSVKENIGVELLKEHLKQCVGFKTTHEGRFSARRRHLDALNRALEAIQRGQEQLLTHKAGELLAEELREAQKHLSDITGQFTSDDLLGKIFSSFCIGK
jgi:tRNA modification GTPase